MNDAQAIHMIDQATAAASDFLDDLLGMTPADQPVHEIASALQQKPDALPGVRAAGRSR